MKVRTRFAPSPTGRFHVGGARTALFSANLARKHGGNFILRIEDTDQKRYDPESEKEIISGLKYLGIEPDEGPGLGGNYGPYRQTERLDIYNQFIQVLLNKKLAYKYFGDGSDEIQKWRTAPPIVAIKMSRNNIPFHIRAKLPRGGFATTYDYLRGTVEVKWAKFQDIVLVKTNGIPTYHFASVVDDHMMEITHVLRGEEWLSTAPIHSWLYEALEIKPPEFVHLPVILNPSGKGKMSKRNAQSKDGKSIPVFVEEYRELGYTREAMLQQMALTGWSPGSKFEGLLTFKQIYEMFSLEKINTTAATWDISRLNNLNKRFIYLMSPDEFADQAVELGLNPLYRDTMKRAKVYIQEKISTIGEAWKWLKPIVEFDKDYSEIIFTSKKVNEFSFVRLVLTRAIKELKKHNLEDFVKEINRPGEVYWIIRAALTGERESLNCQQLMDLLTEEEIHTRILLAFNKTK